MNEINLKSKLNNVHPHFKKFVIQLILKEYIANQKEKKLISKDFTKYFRREIAAYKLIKLIHTLDIDTLISKTQNIIDINDD